MAYNWAMKSYRYALHELLKPIVIDSTAFVAHIQSTRTDTKDKIMLLFDFVGTHSFFMLGLPLFFFGGYATMAINLTITSALGIFVGNCVKDFLCLPRPTCPPVVRYSDASSSSDETHSQEYGMPSTHSSNAVICSFSIFLSLSPFLSRLQWWNGLCICLLYIFFVSFSRIYKGMHGFPDIFGGIILGSVVLFLWHQIGPEAMDAMQHAEHRLLLCFLSIAVIAILVYSHPIPVEATPSFDDSVCFAGTVAGVICGTLLHYDLPYVPIREIHATYGITAGLPPVGLMSVVLRTLIGTSLTVTIRAITKASLIWLLPQLCTTLHIPYRAFYPKRPAGMAHVEYLWAKKKLDSDVPFAVDLVVIIKFISYFAVGFSVTCLAPLLFILFPTSWDLLYTT